MAITLISEASNPIAVDEYVDHILKNVDINDIESLSEAAPQLKALAKNKNIVVDLFNRNLENFVNKRRTSQYNPQSFIIASHISKDKSFFVRGNIWSAISESNSVRALEERVFSYNIAHDHNFYFMTVGYYGPGYSTRIYEYDRNKVSGYIGEEVDLNFLEETTLPEGKVMLYLPGKDVHLQIPPPAMSISLNLMIADPVEQANEQYFFDVDARKIVGYPFSAAVFRRSSLLQLAGHFGNEKTSELLQHIAINQPGARNRITAIDSLIKLDCLDVTSLLERSASDDDKSVRNYSRMALGRFSNSSEFENWRRIYGLDCRQEISTLSRKSLKDSMR